MRPGLGEMRVIYPVPFDKMHFYINENACVFSYDYPFLSLDQHNEI